MMNPLSAEQWQRVNTVLDRVLDAAPDARAAVLDETCAGDAAVRRAVETLLDVEVPAFLDRAALDFATPLLPEDPPEDRIPVSQRIGPYRVIRTLGRGGMGVVYLVEHEDVPKKAALKLASTRLSSSEGARRFLRERRLLAQLEHPHIAQLLDAGVTEAGRPYFTMEYIEGQSLHHYCDERRLSVEERLELFATVGDAVHHAHRSLIVHRDLKPSNILVTEPASAEAETGQVKLLDFGIAKLLEGAEVPEAVPTTRTGRQWMTPEYAAPEQIRGEAVTTATDVYQLGVVLYELLVGHRPFERDGGSLHDLEQAVLNEEPARPSTAVSRVTKRASGDESAISDPEQVGRTRRATPEQLRRTLRGDLDTICLKALRKDPARRYASAEAFVEDIKRYLAGLPVQARPATPGYRAKKFVRRHRWGVAAAALFVLVLAGFAGAMAVQASRIAQERDRAQVETAKAEQVTEFMMGLFEASDPDEAPGDTVTAHDLLERGVERADALDDQPEVQAQMLHAVGQAYMSLGRYERAQSLLERALALRTSVYGTAHEQVAETLDGLGRLLRLQGDYDEAEVLHRDALALRRELLGAAHPTVAQSLNNLAAVLHARGDLDAADSLYREALAMRRKLLGEAHEDIAVSLNNLGLLLRAQGNLQAAEPLLREALAMRRELLGEEHSKVAISLGNLADLLRHKGDYDRAEALFRETLAMWRKLLGEEHPYVATAMNDLGVVLLDKGDLEEARPLLREALTLRRELLGAEHPTVAQSLNNLAGLLRDEGALNAAEARYREALAIRRKLLGEDHRLVALSFHNLAALLYDKGDYRAAELLFRRAIEIQLTAVGDAHWLTAHFKSRWGACLRALARYEEAEPLLIEAYERLRERRGNRDTYTQEALERLVVLYEAWSRPEAADEYRTLRTDAAESNAR